MSAHPTEPTAVASDPGHQTPEARAEAEIVEIAEFRRSRYERNSGSLPHLGDDPDWTPPTFERPTSISDGAPQRWFDRFRR